MSDITPTPAWLAVVPEAVDLEAVDLEAVGRELDDVDVALRRMDEGSYGTCEACGTAIASEVLAAHPAARRCGAHGGPSAAG